MGVLKRFNGLEWEAVGAAGVNISGSGATLGYAEVTAIQASITTLVDLTGLAVTVTVPEGRRIQITGKVDFATTAGAGSQTELVIREGATELQRGKIESPAATSESQEVSVVLSPTAGTHTYKLSARVGSGTVSMVATAAIPAFILVEDISDSTLPYSPSSIPVGRLGYAERLSDQTGVTARVPITGLSVNVSVPAGRTLRIKLHSGLARTVADGVTRFFIVQDGSTIQFKDMFVRGALEGHVNVDFDVIVSPSAGSHTYTADIQQVTGSGTSVSAASVGEPAFLLVEDISPTPSPGSGAPGSTLGYAQITADQTSITTEVDLTGLSTTVTVPEGRRLRISMQTAVINSLADTRTDVNIKEGATYLQRSFTSVGSAGITETLASSVIVTPSAGTHTYKLSAAATGGTATIDAGSEWISYILVEDITGAVWPEGVAVTGGMIASEPWISWSPIIVQGVTLGYNNLDCKYVKIGRTVHLKLKVSITTTGTATAIISVSNLPFASNSSHFQMVGTCNVFDSSASQDFTGFVRFQGSPTQLYFPTTTYPSAGLGNAGFTAALANNDQLEFMATYEAAS